MNRFDSFADALWKFHETGHADLRIERDDGRVDREDVSWYFTSPREFPRYENAALKFARGYVLDVGCGAGRHSLHLQRRCLRVTAMDSSPRIAELARMRGVKDVRVADACGKMPFHDGVFDTVILFGNNLGLCGTLPRFRRMLRELHRITSPRARILATTCQPSTTNPQHRSYLRQNIVRGRAVGQIRLRLVYRGVRGRWFELLFMSPTDLMQIAQKENWELAHVFTLENLEKGYSVVLEKKR